MAAVASARAVAQPSARSSSSLALPAKAPQQPPLLDLSSPCSVLMSKLGEAASCSCGVRDQAAIKKAAQQMMAHEYHRWPRMRWLSSPCFSGCKDVSDARCRAVGSSLSPSDGCSSRDYADELRKESKNPELLKEIKDAIAAARSSRRSRTLSLLLAVEKPQRLVVRL